MWVAGVGFVVTLLVGVIVSRATGGNDILDIELFSNWVHPKEVNSAADNLCAEKVTRLLCSPVDCSVGTCVRVARS